MGHRGRDKKRDKELDRLVEIAQECAKSYVGSRPMYHDPLGILTSRTHCHDLLVRPPAGERYLSYPTDELDRISGNVEDIFISLLNDKHTRPGVYILLTDGSEKIIDGPYIDRAEAGLQCTKLERENPHLTYATYLDCSSITHLRRHVAYC